MFINHVVVAENNLQKYTGQFVTSANVIGYSYVTNGTIGIDLIHLKIRENKIVYLS